MINHQDAVVRKAAIFCFVEIKNAIGDNLFTQMSKHCLSESHEQLICIYLKRKQGALMKPKKTVK